MKSPIRSTSAAALALILMATGVAAQDGPPAECTAPGPELLTDAAGDVAILLSTDAGLPIAELDLLALNVAQAAPAADGSLRLAFTLTVDSMAMLPPSSLWVVSFQSANNRFYSVRMATDATGEPVFDSYEPSADSNGNTNGQFFDAAPVAAEPESNYADGVITIVVKASRLGIKAPGDELRKFGAISTPFGGTPDMPLFTTGGDDMPDDLARRGSYLVTDCAATAKSGGLQSFGGALGPALLLPLALLGLRRRQAR